MAEVATWSLIVLALYVIAWIRWLEAPKDAQKEFTAVVTDRHLSVSPSIRQHRLAVRTRHDRMIAVADSLIGLCFVSTIGAIGTTQSFLFSLPVAVILGLAFRLLASRATTNANRRFAQPQVRLAKLDPRDLNRYLPGPERFIQLLGAALLIGAIGFASSGFAEELDGFDRAWVIAYLITGTAIVIFILVDEMAAVRSPLPADDHDENMVAELYLLKQLLDDNRHIVFAAGGALLAPFVPIIYEENLQLAVIVPGCVLVMLIESRHRRVAKRFPLQEIQPA